MARYELVEGSSRKFWEITLDGTSLTTQWGRIGTDGQSTTKHFADARTAQKEHDALVREKVAKGHSLVSGPPLLQTVDVLSRVRNRRRVVVDGGPVEHPIVRLGDVFRLAWLATDAADPEIRIELPATSRFAPSWPEIENVAVSTADNVVRVGFGSGGKWTQLSAAESISKHFSDLPDGSIVELLTSPGSSFWQTDEDEPEQHPDAGVQRYSGPVGNGTWFIEETFPAVDAATLRDALYLPPVARSLAAIAQSSTTVK